MVGMSYASWWKGYIHLVGHGGHLLIATCYNILPGAVKPCLRAVMGGMEVQITTTNLHYPF